MIEPPAARVSTTGSLAPPAGTNDDHTDLAAFTDSLSAALGLAPSPAPAAAKSDPSSSTFSPVGPSYSPPAPKVELAKDAQLDAGLFDGSLFGLSGNNSSVVFNPTLEAFAMAFGSSVSSPPLVATSAASAAANPLSFDQLLESPLGLDYSPQSSFTASPMFNDSPSLPTTSAPASGSFTPLPFDDSLAFPSLFGPATSSAPATHLRPNPLPLPRRASDPFDFNFSLDSAPPPSPALTASAPTPAPAPAARSASAKRKPTGFKPEIPLLSPDAPVQDRQYALPSSTSRKRQPAVLAKELAKRQRRGEDVSALQTADGELSQDLLDVIDKKRLQNTLAARKSRARKQGRLEELEKENEQLRGENAGLVDRVRRMEEVLEGLGLLPAV